jgi:hypothetical protein
MQSATLVAARIMDLAATKVADYIFKGQRIVKNVCIILENG